MSVASLNLYHHGKHYLRPVPKWMARLFFIIIPKLLFMNIDLPPHCQKQGKMNSKCNYTNLINKTKPLHNGPTILNEVPIEHNKTTVTSVPLVLRSNTLKQQSSDLKSSFDYIQRLIEQNERRCEQQEHNTMIGQEWQILGRVVDRLFVYIFLIGTLFVFGFIFRQAPDLRLK
jgi:hypothetical protein